MNIKQIVSTGALVCCALFSSALALKAPDNSKNKSSIRSSQNEDPFKRGLRGMRSLTLNDLKGGKEKIAGWNKLSGKAGDAGDSVTQRLNRSLTKNGSEMRITRIQKDLQGNKHIRMMQYYKEIPVIGSDIIVHVNQQNEIYLVSGNYSPDISLDLSSIINQSTAIDNAKKYLSGSTTFTECKAALVVFDSIVSFEITLAASDPEPSRWKIYVDARTGAIRGTIDQLFRAAPGSQGSHVPVTGYRVAKEDGTLVTITGWHDTLANYFLYHKTEKWGVYNLNTSDWEQRSSASWGTSDPAAVSLAKNFAITQNFVTTRLGRNSFNNQGGFAQANVHEGTSYVNAYWDGSDFHFGDGDNIDAGPLTTLDISAHEYGHAITQYTSNLVYSYESGALNESFSDILGTWVEFWAQPDGRSAYPQGIAGRADWLCGEDAWLADDALRDLRDPLRYSNPSYYLGTYWYNGSGDNGGVHYNSGVQNKLFYLLAEGGSGTNDGHPYNLTGMGVDTAGQIGMYANMYLLTSSAQYRDARNAWIQAAVTLGYDGNRVSDAWAAVGILPLVSHLSASPTSLSFDSVGVGVSDTMIVTLSNNGGDATLVSSLTFSNPAFTAATTTPFSVAGGATLPLRIVFRPTTTGTFSGNCTITSNAQDNPSITIALSGHAVNPAIINISPRSLSRTVPVGDSTSATLTIANSGQARLNWTISIVDNTFAPVTQPVYEASHFLPIEKGAEDTRVGNPVTKLHGGPDRTGYTWIDSDEPGGPVYQWNDIRSSGTLLSTVSGCDDCYQMQKLSFKFPFYGNSFDTMYVSSNGFITFGTSSSLITNYPLPSTSAPANLIDALHDDLDPSYGGDIYFRDYGDRAVVQIDNVYPHSGSGVYTFQIILERSGNIYVYYNNLTGPLTGSTVGIQNGTRDDGLTVVYNATYLKNALAVKFSPKSNWLSVTPLSGTVTAGQSASVRVGFNGASVPGGTYYGRLDITHNAPDMPSPQSVPCTLWVDGIRRLSAAPTTLNFISRWVGSRDSALITLTNSGDEATVVSSVSSTNASFSCAPALPITVPAFGNITLKVYFQPLATGNQSGVLRINSNAEDNPSINIACSGIGTNPPSITITPTSFRESLLAGDSTSRNLTIYNSGGADLSYSIINNTGGITDDSLKAYWRFDEGTGITINDATPNANTGTISGATWTSGFINSSLTFDGNDDIVTINNDYSMNITRAITLSAWVKPNTISKPWQRAICKDNQTTSSSYILGISSYGGVYFALFQGSTQYYITGTTQLQVGAWNHLVGTWDGTTMRIYLNGVMQSETLTFSGTINTISDPVRIGRATTSLYALNGSIDEARIYSKALNSNDITTLYNNQSEWLSISKRQGTISPLAYDTIKVRFSTQALLGGNYLGSLLLTHNAPSTPSTVEVPCTLHVDGFRRLSTSPSSLNFGSLWVGNRDTLTLKLVNTGNEATQVNSIISNNAAFRIFSSLPVTIPAFDSISIYVIYQPVNIGAHSGTITVSSDAEDNPSISLPCLGTGLAAPSASVRPDSLYYNLLPSDPASTQVCYVYNTGGDTLQYHIQGINQLSSPLGTVTTAGLPQIQKELIYSTHNVENEFVNGRVIIGMASGFSAPKQAILENAGYKSIRELGIARNPRTGMKVSSSRPAFLVTLSDTTKEGVLKAIEKLKNEPSVAFAEPDYVLHAYLTPNDSYFSQLYAMFNNGQTGGTVDADIDATDVWERHTGNRSILIGIIDTGIDYVHPDLAANIWTNPGEIAGNGIDDDNNGYIDDIHGWDFAYDDNNPSDGHYHGTHCAGTVAGVGNNGIGVAGVMWTASLVALKFLDDSGSGSTSDAIDAVNYANAMGIKITSNSWGGGAFSQSLMDAIVVGGLFVAAAGNNGTDNDASPQYPASYTLDNIISVAATDHNDLIASFSCYGRTTVDLGAPGVNIYSCQPGSGYQTLSGTSMATPHVSGSAGLIWTYNPFLSASQVKQLLLDNVDPVSSLNGKCLTGGRLNIDRALRAAGPTWLTASPMAGGKVAPGDSAAVSVTVTPTGLMGGRYEGEVMIGTDDPLHQALRVAVTADIDGFRSLTITPASINFGSIWTGLRDTIQVRLSNTGNETTIVNSVSSSNPWFMVSGTFPLTLAPSGSITIPIIYQPISIGSHSGIISFNSNAEDNPVIELPVSGTGIQGPMIEVTPLFFHERLNAGDSTQRNLNIVNSGDDSLRVSIIQSFVNTSGVNQPINVDPVLLEQLQSAQKSFTSSSTNDTTSNKVENITSTYKSTAGLGNNVLIIQDEYPWGYNVIQPLLISMGATVTTITSSQLASQNLSSFNLIVIPSVQPSSFYANYRTNRPKIDAFVQSGGVLEFHCCTQGDTMTLPGGMSVVYGSSSTNYVINRNHPLTTGVDSILNGSSASHTYFSALPANATTLINNSSSQPTLVTYRFGSGTIVATGMTWEFYYPSGLGNPLLPNTIDFCMNYAGMGSWLSINQTEATVPGHDSISLNVLFRSGNLVGGEYYAQLLLNHNAPASSSPVVVPCTLNVDGFRRLSATPSTLAFETVITGTSDTLLITLSNSGNETTVVNSITSNNVAFSYTGSTPISVAPGSSTVIPVIFHPVSSGNFNGVLTINSNAEDNPTINIELAGTAIAGPSIVVTPQLVNVNLVAGDSTQRTVTIANSGGADLIWSTSNRTGGIISREIHDTIPGVQSRAYSATHNDLSCTYWSDAGNDAFDGFGNPTIGVGGMTSNICMLEGDSSYTINGYRVRVRNDFAENHIYRSIIEPDPEENTTRSDLTVTFTGNMGSDGSETVYLDSVSIGGKWIRFYVNQVSYPNSDPRVVFLIVPSKIEQLGNVRYWQPSSGYVSMQATNISLPATVYIIPSYHDLSAIKAWFQNELTMQSTWLTVSPTSGTTQGGQISNLLFSFNATGLSDGLYYDTISITHNVVDQISPLKIPVELHIGGGVPGISGFITSIGVSALPVSSGTRYRIVDLRAGSPLAGRVQGNRYMAILK